MSLYGPAIPTALLHTPEGPREVHPATDEWWLNLQPLRQASRQGRLLCPDCGGRLVFCVENLPTPYFKHYRGSCLAEAESTLQGADPSRGWLRHHLVTALRRVLPEGTRLACGAFLFGRSSGMRITLPAGGAFQLEIVQDSLDLESWGDKVLACEEEGLPLHFLFTGHRIPAGLRIAPGADPAMVTVHGLNADHDAVATPLRVDMAHALYEAGYGLATLETRPRHLLFFQPGRSLHTPATLAILRGLLPDPQHPGRWHGRLLAAPMTGDGEGPVRFSLRHGFYLPGDLAALRWSRHALRQRLDRAWEAEARKREVEQAQVAAQLARARAEAAARTAREMAFRTQVVEARQSRQEQQARFWQRLRLEGLNLLEGVLLDVPYPMIYRLPDEEWQPRLLAFALRAGVPFQAASAAAWLAARVGLRGWKGAPEQANMEQFWQEAAQLGLVRYESADYIVPRLLHRWPVQAAESRTPQPEALCLLCEQPSSQWVVYDPEFGLCRCTPCHQKAMGGKFNST